LVLKQTARKLVSLVTTQSCVSLVDKVSSEDSQRSSRNSLQALSTGQEAVSKAHGLTGIEACGIAPLVQLR
jgi:hypothetical protein